MRIEQLQYLVEISKSPSMNIASQKLFITPSALSTAIKNLEEELGLIVLDRTHRGISLTDSGKRLVKLAKQFFMAIEEIVQEGSTVNEEGLCGNLGFFTVQGVLNSFLPQLICQFYQKYPNISLEITSNSVNKIFNSFDQTTNEFALVYLVAGQDTHGYTFVPLFRCQLLLQISPTHPLARYKSISFKTIYEYHLVLPSMKDPGIKNYFYQIFSQYGHPPKITYENNNSLYDEMIRTGLCAGLALSSPFYKRIGTPNNDNITVLIKDIPDHHFGYILNHAVTLSRLGQIFLDYLTNYLVENIDRSYLIL